MGVRGRGTEKERVENETKRTNHDDSLKVLRRDISRSRLIKVSESLTKSFPLKSLHHLSELDVCFPKQNARARERGKVSSSVREIRVEGLGGREEEVWE